MNRLPVAAAAVVVALALTACDPVTGTLVGAGATASIAMVQERGGRQAAIDTSTNVGINERLLKKDHVLFGRVNVTVVENRVLLTGVVPKQEDRDEASRLSWMGENVTEVLNELQVTGSTGIVDSARDTWVTTQLRAKMVGDKQVVDINYSLECVNGTVYLFGIGQSQAEVERVIDYARALTNVRHVVSHVMLKDDPRRKKSPA